VVALTRTRTCNGYFEIKDDGEEIWRDGEQAEEAMPLGATCPCTIFGRHKR
jgi:hypothetical protein